MSALDTLRQLGFARGDADVERGLNRFLENQAPDGLWETGYGSGSAAASNRAWVGLATCRILKLFHDGSRD